MMAGPRADAGSGSENMVAASSKQEWSAMWPLPLCTSIGPLIAGALFDDGGSYDGFLLAIVPLSLAATFFIWLIRMPGLSRPDPGSAD